MKEIKKNLTLQKWLTQPSDVVSFNKDLKRLEKYLKSIQSIVNAAVGQNPLVFLNRLNEKLNSVDKEILFLYFFSGNDPESYIERVYQCRKKINEYKRNIKKIIPIVEEITDGSIIKSFIVEKENKEMLMNLIQGETERAPSLYLKVSSENLSEKKLIPKSLRSVGYCGYNATLFRSTIKISEDIGKIRPSNEAFNPFKPTDGSNSKS